MAKARKQTCRRLTGAIMSRKKRLVSSSSERLSDVNMSSAIKTRSHSSAAKSPVKQSKRSPVVSRNSNKQKNHLKEFKDGKMGYEMVVVKKWTERQLEIYFAKYGRSFDQELRYCHSNDEPRVPLIHGVEEEVSPTPKVEGKQTKSSPVYKKRRKKGQEDLENVTIADLLFDADYLKSKQLQKSQDNTVQQNDIPESQTPNGLCQTEPSAEDPFLSGVVNEIVIEPGVSSSNSSQVTIPLDFKHAEPEPPVWDKSPLIMNHVEKPKPKGNFTRSRGPVICEYFPRDSIWTPPDLPKHLKKKSKADYLYKKYCKNFELRVSIEAIDVNQYLERQNGLLAKHHVNQEREVKQPAKIRLKNPRGYSPVKKRKVPSRVVFSPARFSDSDDSDDQMMTDDIPDFDLSTKDERRRSSSNETPLNSTLKGIMDEIDELNASASPSGFPRVITKTNSVCSIPLEPLSVMTGLTPLKDFPQNIMEGDDLDSDTESHPKIGGAVIRHSNSGDETEIDELSDISASQLSSIIEHVMNENKSVESSKDQMEEDLESGGGCEVGTQVEPSDGNDFDDDETEAIIPNPIGTVPTTPPAAQLNPVPLVSPIKSSSALISNPVIHQQRPPIPNILISPKNNRAPPPLQMFNRNQLPPASSLISTGSVGLSRIQPQTIDRMEMRPVTPLMSNRDPFMSDMNNAIQHLPPSVPITNFGIQRQAYCNDISGVTSKYTLDYRPAPLVSDQTTRFQVMNPQVQHPQQKPRSQPVMPRVSQSETPLYQNLIPQYSPQSYIPNTPNTYCGVQSQAPAASSSYTEMICRASMHPNFQMIQNRMIQSTQQAFINYQPPPAPNHQPPPAFYRNSPSANSQQPYGSSCLPSSQNSSSDYSSQGLSIEPTPYQPYGDPLWPLGQPQSHTSQSSSQQNTLNDLTHHMQSGSGFNNNNNNTFRNSQMNNSSNMSTYGNISGYGYQNSYQNHYSQ